MEINFESSGVKVKIRTMRKERICLMKVLSLFDGISCGMLALNRVGIPVEKYDAFEIDKYAVQVSEKNFPEIVHHGNVADGDFRQFQGYDLLLGGSPCTYWSIAKKDREITSDGKGFRLFMEYIRALNESKCRYFLYENNYSIHRNIKFEKERASPKHQQGAQNQAVQRAAKKRYRERKVNCQYRQSHLGKYSLSFGAEPDLRIW